MPKPKVLVADPIAQRGIDELSNGGLLDVTVKLGLKPDELLAIIGEFQGLVVRSETKATAKVSCDSFLTVRCGFLQRMRRWMLWRAHWQNVRYLYRDCQCLFRSI